MNHGLQEVYNKIIRILSKVLIYFSVPVILNPTFIDLNFISSRFFDGSEGRDTIESKNPSCPNFPPEDTLSDY